MAQPTTVELFRQAMAASRSNDKSRTRTLLMAATRIDPTNEAAWQWLAEVAETALEATQAWERVLSLNAKNPQAKAGLQLVRLPAGITAAKGKDIPTARRLLRAVVADDPKSEQGWLWLASVSDSPVEATAHLKRVLIINPDNTAARKGITYFEAKIAKMSQSSLNLAATAAATLISPQTVVMRRQDSPTDLMPQLDPADVEAALAEPYKVLVVDSSRTIRKLVALMLGEPTYQVIGAEDADEAIESIRSEGVPDVIVVDAKLDGMEAHEFCKLLRQHPDTKRVPFILLAGADNIVDKLRCKMAGVTSTVMKPLHPETFTRVVQTHCRSEANRTTTAVST